MTISHELWVSYTRIFFVETAYWIISIGMVFNNKFVLSDSLLSEDLTIFITLFQILFSLAILVTLNYITKHYLDPVFGVHPSVGGARRSLRRQRTDDDDDECGRNAGDQDRLFRPCDESDREEDDEEVLFVSVNHTKTVDSRDQAPRRAARHSERAAEAPGQDRPCDKTNQDSLMQLLIVNIPHRINLETCKIVFPLSILYIGMLLLNNFCLKNVDVAFYFVSRSLTTVFNVIFTYFLIDEPVSRGALICCAFIVLGFILGIDQENVIGKLSVIGVVFGVASSLFGSLNSIYTKKTLAKLDKNIWVLALYNNINSIALCTPLLLVHGDLQSIVSDKVTNPLFYLFLSISGVMAFFISIVTNASIKYTSPLTHNISGTAKACFQTVIAVIYDNEHKPLLWWLSNITILVASAMYSRIRQREMERKTAAQQHQRGTQLAEGSCAGDRARRERVLSDRAGDGAKLNGAPANSASHGDSGRRGADHRRDSSSSGCSATSGRQSRNDLNAQQQQQDGRPGAVNLLVEPKEECCSVKIHPAS